MKRSRLIILISIIIVALLAVAAYAAWINQQNNDPEPPDTTQNTQQQPSENESAEQTEGSEAEPLTLYYVALNDGGESGKEIGCGDSLVEDTTAPVTTADPIKASMEALLSTDDRNVGESGLYNALYQSDLTYESGSLEGDTVTVMLSGVVRSGGACDSPRIEAQLQETAATAGGVFNSEIFINGEPLEDVLSSR